MVSEWNMWLVRFPSPCTRKSRCTSNGGEDLLSQFHNRDFVHGDLRDANVISGDDGCVRPVDFDRGGKDGQVSYPTPNLNSDLSRLTKGRSMIPKIY